MLHWLAARAPARLPRAWRAGTVPAVALMRLTFSPLPATQVPPQGVSTAVAGSFTSRLLALIRGRAQKQAIARSTPCIQGAPATGAVCIVDSLSRASQPHHRVYPRCAGERRHGSPQA